MYIMAWLINDHGSHWQRRFSIHVVSTNSTNDTVNPSIHLLLRKGGASGITKVSRQPSDNVVTPVRPGVLVTLLSLSILTLLFLRTFDLRRLILDGDTCLDPIVAKDNANVSSCHQRLWLAEGPTFACATLPLCS